MTFLTASGASDLTPFASLLLDNFGNQKQAVLHRRCMRLVHRTTIHLGDRIRTQSLHHGQRMCHRLHTRRIGLSQLTDHVENARQLLGIGFDLFSLEFQPRKLRNAADLIRVQTHDLHRPLVEKTSGRPARRHHSSTRRANMGRNTHHAARAASECGESDCALIDRFRLDIRRPDP